MTKIGGPKGPKAPPPPAAVEPPEETAAARTFADLVGPAAGARPAAGPALPAQLAEIVGRIRDGELDAAGAAEVMIERIVQARGARLASGERQQLQQALLQLLREDPTLAGKVRALDSAARAEGDR